MAKKRRSGYSEPDDYIPIEVRRALKLGEFAEDEEEEEEKKKSPYREQSKRLIEKQKKK